MFSPTMMEKVAKEQRCDRLHKAEVDQWIRAGRSQKGMTLKLGVVISGAVLVALMIMQMV